MIEIETKTRKWGNSLGITIPKEIVEKMGIKAEEDLRVLIEKPKATTVKDLFGTLKFKKPTKKLMEEIDKELDIAM